ncbi:hypothetical protein VOLCADRAFT_93017 [Volvox carteri f. nagariensis]|uniref:F-box domain-containing protein n=1 Tax=Volvox carteri f. nagariensis TaxID=3068 RepID=D8U145_VOLCA|nr:uncharacterized protein VOLCADRAFT_93017 [Volvox carteri f. nagariensis]EFJ46496.1 hypothetical protein VOLCADRAFT_93017 [Volvox carteri f. nagariensis]|eukprot:XP_002952353.1 hypothetical protein VOLCADRAFT_93017 [Volvox carteri f. nagariensis]
MGFIFSARASGGADVLHITVLDVSGCHQLGNESVAAVGAQLSNRLTSLDLSGCWLASQVGARVRYTLLGRALRLSGCWRLASGGPLNPVVEAEEGIEVQQPPQYVVEGGEAGVAALQGEGRPPQVHVLLRCTPALQELDLSGIVALSDVDLQVLWSTEPTTGGEDRVGGSSASAGCGGSGGKAEVHDGILPCSQTLTSLSLSSTSISSRVPPLLVASCPSLAHMRVSYCHQLTGCSILAAARIRAAQIRAAVGATGTGPGGRGLDGDGDTCSHLKAGPDEAETSRTSATSGGSGDNGLGATVAGAEGAAAAGFLGRVEGFRTLCAAGLSHWDEEPEVVLGEVLIRRLVDRAEQSVQAGVGGGGRHGGSGVSIEVASGDGGGGAGSGVRSEALTAEALGRAGMVEDLFDSSGPDGCGLAMDGVTYLDLSGTAQFSDMAAARLSACCYRLSGLCLAGCFHLSDEGLSHLRALTRLTSLDLTNCTPGPGAQRCRAPGSAFNRPTSSEGPTAYPASGNRSKRPRHGGVTDRGLAVLLADLVQPRQVQPFERPPAGLRQLEQQQDKLAGIGPFRILRLGGTLAGEAALRSVAGVSRLDMANCKGATDLGVLQALERSPRLQVLKLSGCPQLTAAALGCSDLGPRYRQSAAACESGEPRTAASAGNNRSRNLLEVSLPGGLSYDAAVRWLLGGVDSEDIGTGVSARTYVPGSNTLWALQSLDLGAPLLSSSSSFRAVNAMASMAGTVTRRVAAGITDDLLQRLPSCCPLLRTLRLRGAVAVTDAGAGTVLRGCRLLRRFMLTGSPHVTDATLALAIRVVEFETEKAAAVAVEESSLLHLDLSDSESITGRFLLAGTAAAVAAASNGDNQTAATPPEENCPQLSGLALVALLGRCPHLRELTAALDADGLGAAARFCPSLSSLRVTTGLPAAAVVAQPALNMKAAMISGGSAPQQLKAWPVDWGHDGQDDAARLGGRCGSFNAQLQHQYGSLPPPSSSPVSGRDLWSGLTRLVVPAALRQDTNLRKWAADRPWLQVTNS